MEMQCLCPPTSSWRMVPPSTTLQPIRSTPHWFSFCVPNSQTSQFSFGKIPWLCNTGEIVAIWTKENGPMSGLLFGAKGKDNVLFTIITHSASTLQTRVLHLPYRCLAGLKFFKNTEQMRDASGNGVLWKKVEVRPVAANKYECNGSIAGVDLDDDCCYICSLDFTRAIRIVSARPSELFVLTSEEAEVRKSDRRILNQVQRLGTKIVQELQTEPSEQSSADLSRCNVQNDLEILLAIRSNASLAVQTEIIIPHIKTILQSAHSIDDSFATWILGSNAWNDAILQDFIATLAEEAEQIIDCDTFEQQNLAALIEEQRKRDASALGNNNDEPPPKRQNTDQSPGTEERDPKIDDEGYHRQLRQLGTAPRPTPGASAVPQFRSAAATRQAAPRTNAVASVPKLGFQICSIFRSFPKSDHTMRSYTDGEIKFTAGDLVKILDQNLKGHAMVTCLARCVQPPFNGIYASMKAFSDDEPYYSHIANIKKITLPWTRRVYRSADKTWIGNGDVCRTKVLLDDNASVFVCAIVDNKCIYALPPSSSKVQYGSCECSELRFKENGPPEKFDIGIVAYDRSLTKNNIPKVRSSIEAEAAVKQQEEKAQADSIEEQENQIIEEEKGGEKDEQKQGTKDKQHQDTVGASADSLETVDQKEEKPVETEKEKTVSASPQPDPKDELLIEDPTTDGEGSLENK